MKMYSLHHIILFAEKCNIVSLVPLAKFRMVMGCIFIHDDYHIMVGLGRFSEYTGLKCFICDVLFDMSSLMYFIAKPFEIIFKSFRFSFIFY